MYIFKCPYPGCGHIANIITSAHCKESHSVTLKEVKGQHGDPQKVEMDNRKLKGNLELNKLI